MINAFQFVIGFYHRMIDLLRTYTIRIQDAHLNAYTIGRSKLQTVITAAAGTLYITFINQHESSFCYALSSLGACV